MKTKISEVGKRAVHGFTTLAIVRYWVRKQNPLLAYACLHLRQWFTNLRCKVQKPLSRSGPKLRWFLPADNDLHLEYQQLDLA
jgi:hypothetical protein